MANELYTVMVNSGGVLEYPSKHEFLENNNLVTKDEVSTGLVAHPKNTGYADYPNKVGSKGWYVTTVGIIIGSETPRAVITLSNIKPETLGKITDDYVLQNSNNPVYKPSDNNYTTVNDIIKTKYGFEIGDRLTIICQECNFIGYTGSGQFQAILKVVGYNDMYTAPIVELDTSLPYCDTVFNRGTSGEPTLEKIFYAWLNVKPNDSFGDSEDAIATRALIPDINTVRVYGKPELGVVDLLTSAVVDGINNEASGQGSQSFGRKNTVTATSSAAFGRNHLVAGYASTAFGQNNKVYGEKNLVTGMGNTTYGLYSTAIGKDNTVGDKDSGDKESNTAIGTQNTINGICAVGIGFGHNVSGSHSVSLGETNTITGNRSFAAGRENTINTIPGSNSADNHIALGFNNTISGKDVAQSVAIGSDNVASHIKVYEFGTGLQSSDRDQVILGKYNATLPADTEFAIGVGTTNARKTLVRANTTKLFVNDSPVVTEAGCNSLQIGNGNTTNKNYTLTVGNTNTNNSENGFVAGKQNINNNETHYPATNLLGEFLKQSPLRSSTVVGTYNDNSVSYLFSVGAGTADNNRKNCFGVNGSELYANVDTAKINVSGKATVNGSEIITSSNLSSHGYIERIAYNPAYPDDLFSADNIITIAPNHNPSDPYNTVINIGDWKDSLNGSAGGSREVNINAYTEYEGISSINIRAFGSYTNATIKLIADIDETSPAEYNESNANKIILDAKTGVKFDTNKFQVPIFNEDGTRTEDYATIKVVRNSSGQLQLVLS